MSEIFDKIQSPADIRDLNEKEMRALSEELRTMIISGVSQRGGHLSSNLGVVELTIAMLSRFNFADEDQIVWDVGHQSYTYKLLTGRKDFFSTLRQHDGYSGFPKRSESPYDFFNTGHSSTSISAALGLLRAKELKGEKGKVIAVIGDGALTGGLAYEALNDAGQFSENLIVILNDNMMSIDNNVGALSRKLASMRSSQRYIRLKTDTEKILLKIPVLGRAIFRLIALIKDSIRIAIRRSHPVIFEDLGFRYYGPIDGHNIPTLLRYLDTVKNINKPVLLHVCTKKGKGYDFAEASPSRYHGVVPFDIDLGCESCGTSTFTSMFGKSLIGIAEKNPKVVAVCPAMMSSAGLEPFNVLFPDRFFDVGIAEEHALTMAAGLSANGLVPVVAIYSTFLQRGYDQVLHDICLQNLHVVLAIDRSGIVGQDGETHQGLYDISLLMSMPTMEILAPRNYFELDVMLRYAIAEAKGPVAVRYPRSGENSDYSSTHTTQHGKAMILREGTDITILAAGVMSIEAMQAALLLAEHGYRAEVIDLRWLKPLDESSILASIKKTGLVIICEDGISHTGVSSQIAMLMLKRGIHIPFASIGVTDHALTAGLRSELMRFESMDEHSIAQVAIEMLKQKEFSK